MTAEGHKDAFPRPRMRGRCRFSQRTFTRMRRNGQDAPKEDIARGTVVSRAIAALLSDCHWDPATAEIPDPTVEAASDRRAAARTEPALRQGIAWRPSIIAFQESDSRVTDDALAIACKIA